jgi:hypothetical protein
MPWRRRALRSFSIITRYRGEEVMRLTVELTPDVESYLVARAREQGVLLAVYVQTLIEQMVVLESPAAVALEEFEADMDTVAEGSETLPLLPSPAYSRESICGNEV